LNKRLIVAVISICSLVGFGASMAVADPNLANVSPHRHFIRISATESVQVGPRVCDDASLQSAFNQFHNNLHVLTATGIGPVAPGLHNGMGAEITATGC
jgi:hypothetical protein